jgi:glucokinase
MPAFALVSSTTATDLLANVSSAFGDNQTGLLYIAGAVGGVYVAFWVVRKLIGLIPKGR